MTQPTEELIIWANKDVNLPELAGPNKTKPIDDLINKGWDFTEKPTADEFNYILNNMGKWINWAIENVDSGTSLNTPNTLVRRDGSGNFSAGTITAALAGNAATASKWQTPRTLEFTGFATGNGSVDGSGNVSITLSMGSGFTSSKATNGYTYLPNGMIFQWGYTTGNVTFPITFPNSCSNVSITSTNTATNGYDYKIAASGLTTTGFSITRDTDDAGVGVYWFAIGY